MPGFLGAMIAKLVGGTVAKAAIAAIAALTMVVGGGAVAGIIPVAGGNTDPVAIAQPALDQANNAVESALEQVPTAPPVDAVVPAAEVATVTPPTGSASANDSTNVATPTELPAFPVVGSAIPAPDVSCVTDLIPSGGVPDPTQLVAELPACILSVVTASLPLDLIQDVIDSAGLPVDISGCLTSVLDAVPTFATGDLSGLSGVLSGCLPSGAMPGSGTGSIPDFGSFFPGSGSGTGSIPDFGSFFPGFGSGSSSGTGSGFGSFFGSGS